MNKEKHPLEDTLQSLKDFKEELSNYNFPKNSDGWSLSNLPSHFWQTIGECINDIEQYIKIEYIYNGQKVVTKTTTNSPGDITNQEQQIVVNWKPIIPESLNNIPAELKMKGKTTWNKGVVYGVKHPK